MNYDIKRSYILKPKTYLFAVLCMLVAVTSLQAITVTFEAAGGTVSPASKTVILNQPYGTLPAPSKAGSTFNCWIGGGYDICDSGAIVLLNYNHTLTANWTINYYDVDFDAAGGTPNPSSESKIYGSTYGALPTVVRDDYTFGGWWTGPGGTGVRITSSSIFNAQTSITLYARWITSSYIVTFDAQSGVVTPVTANVIYNSTYGALPIPTKTGYTFEGWWTIAGGAGEQIFSSTTVTITAPQTLYAKWTITRYALYVISPLGISVPPCGANQFSDGTVVFASITNSPIWVSLATQFVCVGWTGTGSVPSSGVGTNTGLFTLTNNSSVTWLWSTNTLTNVLNLTVIPDKGPFAGGNTVCVTNTFPILGNGLDITNVTVGGVDAVIKNQGVNWVSFVVPAMSMSGVKDVVVRSVSLGNTVLPGIYTVNPCGKISGAYSWNKLSNAFVPINNRVRAIANDGTGLYVGGDFTKGGSSIEANRIVRWDPTSGWTALGVGVAGGAAKVSAMFYYGTNLYVGGVFLTAGGITAKNIAKWNQTTGWTSLGNGLDDGVNSLSYLGANLFAGGVFLTGSSLSLGCIAKWNPTTGWSSLSHDLDGNVSALANDGTKLFAGGQFIYSYNGTLLNRIGKWSLTSDWSPLNTGVNGNVASLVHDGTNLYVGGAFTTAGPSAASYIAKWNLTTGWSTLGSGVNGISASVNALLFDGANLYVGGVFTNAGGIAANNIAKWNQTTGWSSLSSGMNGSVDALAYDGTSLYAGGNFTSAGGRAISYIAKWMPDSGILPSSGSCTGGYQVVISGINLGSGGDITNVTICGVSASNIIDQSGTQVVVAAGSSTPGPGEVKVYSESFGVTIKSNAFIYNPAIEILFGPHGAVTPNHITEVIYGGTTSFVVKADAYYHIESMFTNGIRVAVANNKSVYTSSWSNVTTTGLIYVAFAENLTTNTSTPECWLAQYGWTNNFEAAATNDSDGDGMLNWQEWVAGCDPKDSNSLFRFTRSESDSAGQGVTVRWPSISNRFYDLSRATNLMGKTPFTVFPDASNMPARPPENVYTDSVQGVGAYFYKVGVHE